MKTTAYLAIALVVISGLAAVAKTGDIIVAIDSATQDSWESLASSFEQTTGASIGLRSYSASSLPQQIVLQTYRSAKLMNLVMVPQSWVSMLARYLVDLTSISSDLSGRGVELVSSSGRAVGVPISFAQGWILAVVSWPSNQELAIEFLAAAAAQQTSETLTPTPFSVQTAITVYGKEKIARNDHNPVLDGSLEALLGAVQQTLGAVATQLMSALPVSSRNALSSLANLYSIPFTSSTSTVTVVLESSPGRSSASNVAALGALGVSRSSIAATSSLIKVEVPVSQLATIVTQMTGISFIRPPYVPYPLATTSQGVAAIGADALHASGNRGAGTKIAVIDLGFSGLSQAQARGDLPYSVNSNDLTGTGLATGITHGTAVAEIVHDMAPDAQLYLIKIADEVDLDLAVTYCQSNGIDIINHSLGWYNTNFYDGTGTIADIAKRAVAGGMLWINAAGNEAESHWEGYFSDGNSDNWNDQNVTFHASGGSSIVLYLTWNDWPQASSDYDLYLFDPGSNLVASSTKHQTGTEEPTESINVSAPMSGTYTVRIQGSGSRRLELFNLYQGVSPNVASSSILAPGNVSEVVTVAAIDHSNYTVGPQQPYSSQGPTNDGRTKPDLAAPDNVSTGTAPYTTFPGTSGAAPHVAGAAALLLSANPSLSEPALRMDLLSNTIPMGSAYMYGNGRLVLAAGGPSNLPPTAAFVVTPSSGLPGQWLQFNGATSQDPDGSIVSYAWDYGDGSTGTGSTSYHSFASAGTYTVQLTVTDDDAATGTTTEQVVVGTPTNQPPTAAFTVSPGSGIPGTTFTFNASGSTDPAGSIVSYQWTFGDGASASGMTPQHAYAAQGTYSVQLLVRDDDGATDTMTTSVVVTSPANQPPNAAFTFSPGSGLPGTTFAFNASGSGDPDGSIVSYQWTFGDGSSAIGITAQHAYAAPGTYSIQLLVRDDDGATDTMTQSVVVTSPANVPPTAAFTVSPSSGSPGTQFAFNASGSTDQDGSIVSYQWTFGDGSSAFGVTAQHAYAGVGTYSVQLLVRDDDGATDTETKSVSVQVAAAPDLTISSITPTPTHPVVGQNVTFTITVRNVGTAPAGRFRILLSGSVSGTETVVYSLASGATRTLSLTLPLTSVSEIFTATADDSEDPSESNRVAESNEANNQASITVTAGATPVVAEAGGPYAGTAGSSIAVNGSGSTGPITTYLWSFGDGGSAQGMNPSHTYASPETYTVTLTVYGTGGTQSSDTAQVSVSAAAPPLLVQLSLPQSTYEVGDAIVITFTTNRSAYVYLAEVSPDNRVVLLYPNWIESANPLGAGTHTVPGAAYTLRITEPTGTETLYLFAATGPISGFPTTFGAGFPVLSTNPSAFRSSTLGTMQSQFASGDWAFDTLSFTVVQPQPTTGAIRVLSSPSGATVRIDGSTVGTTTVEQGGYAPGSHTVEISLAGFATQTHQATVVAGQTTTLQVTLIPLPPSTGTLRVETSPAGAIAEIDGTYVGTTPVERGNLAPGTHTVEVSLAGYFTETRQATVVAGQTTTVQIALSPIPPTTGTIRVESSPAGAIAEVDGTYIGTTPAERANLAPGSHTVEVSLAGYFTETQQASVTAGQTTTVQITLTQIPVNASPVASFAYTPARPALPVPGQIVRFDASTSYDPDGSIVSYTWEFGDTTTGIGPIVDHAYSVNGSYLVTLTVIDSGGTSGTHQLRVSVTNSPEIGWVTPVAHEDPADNWYSEEDAYDANLNSRARYDSEYEEWTSYLYLTAPSPGLQSNRLRFRAGDAHDSLNVLIWDVDVYRDGQWVDVFEHHSNENKTTEVAFAQGLVTRMRIRAYGALAADTFAYLFDVDFHDISATP